MEHPEDLTLMIGSRVSQRRAGASLSLDDLAERTGVSRAMISRVERGEVNASAVVLDRLCDGLGMTLSELFARTDNASPLQRFADQPVWRDPESHYIRRGVSPPHTGSPVRIAEVEFPPRAEVTLSASAHRSIDQHIWCLEGEIEIAVGGAVHALQRGDCLHMRPDAGIRFANRTDRPARYAIIITSEARHERI